MILSSDARLAPCSEYRKELIFVRGSLYEVDQIDAQVKPVNANRIHGFSLNLSLAPTYARHSFLHLALVNVSDFIGQFYDANLARESELTFQIKALLISCSSTNTTTTTTSMPRKRPHESISGGEGGGSSSNGTNLANSNNSGRPPARSRHPPQNVMLGELELLLTPAAAVGEEDMAQQRNNNSGHNNQARISRVSGAIGGGGAAHTDSATFAMAQRNAPHMLDGRGGVAVDGRASRVDNLAGISVAQPPTIAAGNNANNNNHNGDVLQRSIGGSGDGSGGAFGSAFGAVSGVPVWSVSSRGVNGSVSSLADGSEMVHAVGQPLSLRSTVGLGIGGGLEALPRRVREAVAQVNAQQLQRMASKQPEFATVVPPIAESGFSNIHWLLLEWTADMVMNRIVGLVVLAGPFTTQSDISGFDVRLIFDQQNMDHELAMHGWQECVARMNNISTGQIVEFTRLKVREQGRNGNVKGRFPFTLLYNGESRHRVLGQAPAAVTNAVCSPNFNTPIIVEANDQHQHSSSNGTIIGGGDRGGNDLNNPSINDSADNDALPAQLTNRPDQVNITDIGDEQRLLIQSNDEDAEEDDFDRAGHSGGGGSSTMSNGALFSAMAAPGTVVVRNEDSGSSSCNAWRQIGRGRPSITNRSGNDDNTSGSNSETAAVTTVSANSGHSDDRAGARDSDGQRLDSFCKVIGAWERTECRSRNTRCEAVEAKQFCVECEHPVDRRTHPLGCRAVCGLCVRYDELRFPCRRQGGDGSSGTFCQQCRFVFPSADCFEAHRRRVDVAPAPPPGVAAAAVPHGADAVGAAVAPAFADRRRGRPHRSMCEERRLCEWCNVVVWARSGPHVCRRRPQQQQHQQQQEENRAVLQQQQQQNHHNQQPAPPKCEKCGGPHDPERTPHFIQPKQYARQCQWRRGAARGAHDNADDGAVADAADAAAAVADDDDDDVSEEEGAEAGAARGGVGDGARGRLRKPKPVRFIFWDVECAQERVGEQQEQLEGDEAEAAHGAGDEAGAMDAVQQQQQQLPELLKHVPVLVCAEVICERCIAYGVDIEREPLRRAPQCQCGVPWRGANRRRWCSRIGEEQFDDDTNGPATAQQQQQQQMPPDGLNPRRLRFFCDGEPGTGRGAMAQFVDFLLHTGPKGTRTVMLAQNGGRYDVHLLLEELQRRGERPKKAVQHGLRVYMLELRGTHQRQLICKDSLNFFHAALATLPRTFGLRGVLDKPFFPYHHIREQNLDVELPAGTLPPPAAYDPDRMRAAQRADFMAWYERELYRPGRQPFVLRRELLRYCWNDVRILRAACLRFRELPGHGGVPPTPSAPAQMVHTPEGGFLRGRRASAESRRFFALLAAMRPDLGPLRTARWSVGEMVVDNSSWGGDDDGFRLDCVAYRRPPLRPLCIEFNGCYMHGCRECYPEREMVLAGGRSAELLWARTQQRAWELAELHGMQVQSVWECQFRRMLRNSPRMRKLYNERCVDVPVPLDLRKHALFGGRVEPFWLLYSCAPDEEIVYIDIVSLYPYCMKTRQFPIGRHVCGPVSSCGSSSKRQEVSPTLTVLCIIYTGPPPPALRPSAMPWCRPEDNPFRGFLFCRVLPPSADELGDREPLLPYRTQADGRLTFGLCARCAELRQQRTCRHTERERAWTAAYTHVELNRALLLGYRVLQVHERLREHTFLRLKAEASGWPAGCDDEAARAEHVRQFAEQEGVHLRRDNIGHNPGLRQLAKDLLNSLWGKMAERPERDEVVYTDSARAFHELLMDARQEVVSFTHINEQLDRCVVRKREPFARAPEHNNLAVACFVTSHARLYLYEWLEEVRRVGGRALYCDTDSVLYVRRLGAAGVREGNALGDMKRELPGRRIIDFFAAGPKNYRFQHVDARTGQDLKAERKVRSFELTYAADQQLQYGRMRQLVINHFGRPEQRANHGGVGGGGGADIAEAATEQRTIAVPCQRFVRSRQADIFTRRSTRVYRPVYTKGRVLRPPTAGGEAAAAEEQAEAVTPAPLSIRTRPFGWCSAEAQQMETDDEEEEEREEEADANSDDAGGESDGLEQPVRKRARADPVEEMHVEVEEAAPAPVDPDLEEEPVAGCSTWNQQRRLNEHIFRN
ncbi:hypothetical protein niasHS_011609 [Heterodera schachtii]|uniref:DNA-directed DNA polymerase n=1 Tax=Heterodera schachtii TaxID=97005 RepID=A0ABD2IFA3_HETSC